MLSKDIIDEDELILRAKTVLENYEIQHELSKRKTSIGSPDTSGMPKGSKKGNPQESKILDHVNANDYCKEVLRKINELDDMQRQLLTMRFINQKLTTVGIAEHFQISERTYARKMRHALLEFGLSCDLIAIPLKDDTK